MPKYFKITLGVLFCLMLLSNILISNSLISLLYNISEGGLIGISSLIIFLGYIEPQKYKKLLYVGVVLFILLITHVLKILYLIELGGSQFKLIHFVRLNLFSPTFTIFISSVAFGFFICVLFWFSKASLKIKIKSFTILGSIILIGGISFYIYINRNLENKGIIFDYSMDTLEEIQAFAIKEQKTLYLDFWHSGCKPCLEEFAKHHQFKTLLDSNKVQLMFIGTDLSIPGEKYKQKLLIEKYDLKGTHSFVSREYFFKILDDAGYDDNIHGIKAFPHHMIIGHNGEVIEIKAGKPSKEIIETLNNIY